VTTYVDPFFHGEQYPRELDGHPDVGTPRIPSGVVELRVHGVAGGTPEKNLGDPHPIKIDGDDEAGIYRRHESLNSGPERTVEAYNWSSINSGPTARAFWLALFPFAAANFAGWLLPADMADPRDDGSSPWRWLNPWNNRFYAQFSVRGIALVVTGVAMLGMAAITVDILALQCGAKGACETRSWLGWIDTVRNVSFLTGQPARLAILGTAVPLLALGVLWYVGKRSTSYERYGTSNSGDDLGSGPHGSRIDTVRLDEVGFWQSPDSVYIQGWLHTSVALATLGAMLAASMRVLAPTSSMYDVYWWFAFFEVVWLAGIAIFVVLVARMQQVPRSWLRRSNSPAWRPRWTWLPASVPGTLLVSIAVVAWNTPSELPASYTVLEPIRNSLIVATLIGLVFLTVLGLVVGAWRILLVLSTVGAFWYVVLVTKSRFVGASSPFAVDPAFSINVGGGWGWVLVEAVIAAVFVGVVWILSKRNLTDDPTHRHGLLWIIASAGALAGLAMGADARAAAESWGVFGVAAGIVVVYMFSALAIRVHLGRTHPKLDAPEHGTMRSGTAFVLAAVALGSILTISASSAVWVSRLLGRAVPHSGSVYVANGQIAYPAEAGWFALAAFAGVFVLVALVIIRMGTLRWFRWRGDVVDAIDSGYDGHVPPSGADHDSLDLGESRNLAFARRSRTLRLLANIVDDVDWMVTAGVLTTLAILTASVLARFRGGQPAGRLNDAIGFAALALAFLVVVVFFVIRSARDDRQVRATIGILWDVMSFFPRRFHPLGPPCYSERTVIDVRNRLVRYHNAEGAKGTVLLAHSQGTMITTAALLSLRTSASVIVAPKSVRPRGCELDTIAFVTYGCMLERLFRRAWPDQLRRSDLVDLKARLELGPIAYEQRATSNLEVSHPDPSVPPRWMSFGRYSDYLGGRVFTGPQVKPSPVAGAPDTDERQDDIMFGDPTRRWRYEGETSSARSWLHSFDYESDEEDPRFRRHVWAWLDIFN